MHRKLNRGRERTTIPVQREHFAGKALPVLKSESVPRQNMSGPVWSSSMPVKVDFVDLSEVPTDLAKQHGLDFFSRTWLESKMAQHHPVAFNMCHCKVGSEFARSSRMNPNP